MSFWQSTNFINCNSWVKRLRGLYFRREDTICAIYPCNCIHTFFFKKNIDVAFVDRNNKVIKVVRNLVPWRVVKNKKSFCVIERYSNNDKSFLSCGDTVNF